MNWTEVSVAILWIVFTFAVIFVFIAATVGFQFAAIIFVICAIIGLAGIIDGLRRD